MSTRGCIIELKKDVCKVGYLHYGANFASKLIHYGMLGLTFQQMVVKTILRLNMKEEWWEYFIKKPMMPE